jgi:hypothetical protein
VAGQMRPVVKVNSSSYSRGAFYKLWMATALERTQRIREARMATAPTKCPRGTPNRKRIVAGQMRPVAVVGSCSYIKGAFFRLWTELK